MSLRLRLGAALVLLAAIAVSVAALVAYFTTADRLGNEANQLLTSAATRIMHAQPPAPPGNSGGPPASRPNPAAPGPRRVPPLRPDLLDLVVQQRINPQGVVTDNTGGVTLPVTSAVRELAENGGPSVLSTVRADGDPYRIIAESVNGGGVIELGLDIASDDAILSSLQWRFVLLDLIVTVLAALLGWLIARRLARPVVRLTEAVEDVTSTGSLLVSVDQSGSDEVARLARAFSGMLGALARSRAQQRQLLEDAGHELRTPLTSLRSNIELLRRHRDLPTEVEDRVLSDLSGELGELTGLVNELIDLAGDRYDDEPVVAVHVDDVAQRVVARALARSGREIHCEASSWTVQSQEGAIERAITNIVENAIKFSSAPAPINVAVVPGSLEVRDYGIGIPIEDIDHVFDRFYRVATARSEPGSGLGLSIVREVAERFGGHVFARNAPDGGAIVGFEIPSGDQGGANDIGT